MRQFFVLFISVLGFTAAKAQINELGIIGGGSNYIGDVGPTDYIHPTEGAFGAIYKWNRSPRHAWRISYIHYKITADDDQSEVAARSGRDFDFENTIDEVSLGMEFNFFDFDLHQLERQFTPYVYTGLSFFAYNELVQDADGYSKDTRDTSFAIPMVVGLKGSITPSLVLGFEVGARYTFTDNLDSSNPKNENLAAGRFGNINSKDWYVFTGFTLTYTFTEKPCFCAE